MPDANQNYYQQQQEEQQLPFTWQDALYFPVKMLKLLPEILRNLWYALTRLYKT